MMSILGRRKLPIIKIVVAASTIWITILILIASDEKHIQDNEYIPLKIDRNQDKPKPENLSPLDAKQLYRIRLRATLEPHQERSALKGFGYFLDFIDPGIIEDWSKPPKGSKNKTEIISTQAPLKENAENREEEDDMIELREINVNQLEQNDLESKAKHNKEMDVKSTIDPITEINQDYIQDPVEDVSEVNIKKLNLNAESRESKQKSLDGAIVEPPSQKDEEEIMIAQVIDRIVDEIFEKQDEETDSLNSKLSLPVTLDSKVIDAAVYAIIEGVFEKSDVKKSTESTIKPAKLFSKVQRAKKKKKKVVTKIDAPPKNETHDKIKENLMFVEENINMNVNNRSSKNPAEKIENVDVDSIKKK